MRRTWLVEAFFAGLAVALAMTWLQAKAAERQIQDEVATEKVRSGQIAATAQRMPRQARAETAESTAPIGSSGLSLPQPMATAIAQGLKYAERGQRAMRKNLDDDYAALFRKLALPADKLNAVRDLLAERRQAEADANRLAQSAGFILSELPDRAAILDAATEDIDDQLYVELGSDRFAQFEQYQRTDRNRKWLVGPLADRLKHGPDALTEDQIDALASSVPEYFLGTEIFTKVAPSTDFPDTLIEAAKAHLSPSQFAEFERYQTVWNARRDMAHRATEAVIKEDVTKHATPPR